MPDMAVDGMQSSTLELNKNGALQNAHTNLAIAKKQKRTSTLLNEHSVGDGNVTAQACSFCVQRCKSSLTSSCLGSILWPLSSINS
jgi:hypothetical protein